MRKSLLAMLFGMALSPFAFAQQMVVVYSDDTVAVGTTRQFTTYVNILPSTVTWSVNGVQGGNATLGTVSSAGLYKAPPVAPMPNIVTVTATSTAKPSISGSAKVTVQQPTPMIWSTNPTSLTTGNFTISLNGANFVPGAVVNFNGAPLTTTYVNSTALTATGTASTAGASTITVTNPDPGKVTSDPRTIQVAKGSEGPSISVTVSPQSPAVNTGAKQQFTASVANSTNQSVSWSVNGVSGGNATVGTITSAGLYTAPAAVPSPATVTVRATSAANVSASGSTTVTIKAGPPPAPPTLTLVAPTSIPSGSFTITLTGTGFVQGAVAQLSGVNLATSFLSSTQLSASGTTNASGTNVSVTVANPSGAVSNALTLTVQPSTPTVVSRLGAARFLEQATFGPTPATLQQVQQIGFDQYLQQQFSAAETPIPIPANTMDIASVKAYWMYTLASAPDQVRQKMAYALGQMFVVSTNKDIYADEYVPWLQLLSRNAFGNYRTLLREVTISPSMGKYLDLANSNKPGNGSQANENYPREVMQLFSIGLWQLNNDGSLKLDGQGNPIPTYNQTTIHNVALALTGWTYPTAPGAKPQPNNWEYFSGPMEPRDQNHDMTSKTLLNGVVLPPNQTTVQDLDAVVDCLFNHPNVPPFLATRLIRSLVKSNPSPAYISRVANVFIDNGSGVRGDLKAVLKAVLLDPEARQDTPDVTSGRLRDPLGHIIALVRALNGQISATNQFAWSFVNMAQEPLTPASVFSFYSPQFRVPHSTYSGPEFQIYGPTEYVLRSNFIYDILTGQVGSDIKVDLSQFLNYAGNTQALLDAVDNTLMYGRMPAGMRQSLTTAIAQQPDNQNRMMTAVYLTATSSLYAVQY